MKRTTTYILLFVLAALIGLVVYRTATDRKTTLPREEKAFAVQDTAKVDKIFLADRGGGKALLERKGPGHWTVNGKYRADQGRIELLLESISAVAVKNPVGKAARETYMKDIASGGYKAEIYSGGEKLKTYYVGGATPDNLGTVFLMEGSENPYIMHIPGWEGFLTVRYYTGEADWRDKTAWQIDPATITEVRVAYPLVKDSSFVLRAQGGKFTVQHFEGGASLPVPPARAKEVLVGASEVQFEGFVPKPRKAWADSLLAAQPFAIVDVKAEGATVPQLKLYVKKADQTTKDVGPGGIDQERYFGVLSTNPREVLLFQFFALKKVLHPYPYLVQ